MNKDGNRIVLIALTVACFILLYSTVAFYVMEESEKGKRHALQKKVDEITVLRQDLEAELKETETLAIELRARLTTQEDTISNMTKALDEERHANNTNLFKLKERENEIRAMRAKIDNEKAEKDNLLKKLEAANEECLGIKAQLENDLKSKAEEDVKAKEISEREGLSLGTVVVGRKGR